MTPERVYSGDLYSNRLKLKYSMGTGIGYSYEARARLKGRYGTGEDLYMSYVTD